MVKKISLKNILLYVFIGLAVFGVATFAVVQSLIGDSNYTVSATEVLTTSQLKQIQQKLKNWGYYTGKVDGINGPKTIAAVKSFQRKNGLKVDGIVGTKTAQAMGISLGSTNQNSDLYLLAKTIQLGYNKVCKCLWYSVRGRGQQSDPQVDLADFGTIRPGSSLYYFRCVYHIIWQ